MANVGQSVTCTAFFILVIILGFLVLLASDLLLGRKASKRAGFLVGLAVSSPLFRRSVLLLRLVDPDRVPEVLRPPALLVLDKLEWSTCCCGRGVDLPEPGALPVDAFLIFRECDPQVPGTWQLPLSQTYTYLLSPLYVIRFNWRVVSTTVTGEVSTHWIWSIDWHLIHSVQDMKKFCSYVYIYILYIHISNRQFLSAYRHVVCGPDLARTVQIHLYPR